MKKQGNFYLEFAKSTEWNDPKHPDAERSNAQNLSDSQVFTKVDTISVVYDGGTTSEVNDGDNYVVYKGHKWLYSSDADAYKNNAHFLLLRTTIDIQEVPAFTYHQIGVRQGTKIPNNVHSATPDAVTSKGTLYGYENRLGQSFTDAMKLSCSYLFEF